MMRLPFAALVLCAGLANADDAAAKKFLKDLEGSYTVTGMTRGGESAPDDFVKGISVSIKGDTLTATFKTKEGTEHKAGILVVDPSQKPVAIDMTPKDGPDAGKPVLGVVKVEGDTVTICWGDQHGKAERPKDFSSTKENKHLVMVLKKAR
jgi:uncharacterized protein (TIGR03067 family)